MTRKQYDKIETIVSKLEALGREFPNDGRIIKALTELHGMQKDYQAQPVKETEDA